MKLHINMEVDRMQYWKSTTFQIVFKEELIERKFDAGGEAHMYQALNQATSMDTQKIILISDLQKYEDVKLRESKTLKSLQIYDLDDTEKDVQRHLKKKFPTAEISIAEIK